MNNGKCPRCGTEYENTMNFCPKCGMQTNGMEMQYQNTVPNQNQNFNQNSNQGSCFYAQNANVKKKDSILSIISFLIAFMGCGYFSIVGLVLAFIDLATDSKKQKSHGWSTAAICASLIWAVIMLVIVPNWNDNDDRQNIAVSTMAESEAETYAVTVEEKKIYSKNNVDIYVKGYDQEDNVFRFYVENNSNLNLGFNAHAYSVNGIMTNNNIYDMDYDVAKNSKANMELKIKSSFLEKNNITEIKYLDILFWAYDNAELMKSFDTGVKRIKTSAYKKGKVKLEGTEIYNQKGLKANYIRNDNGCYIFGIKNNSGEYVDVDVNNVTINGFTSSDLDFDLMGIIVFDKNISEMKIEPNDEFLSKNGINEIETIEFSLEVRPKEDYFSSYNTDTIKANVK